MYGFVNIIKPSGVTSFDVVRSVKKILQTKHVGHLGTLDPAAAGVLPIAVGLATKFFDYFLDKDKIYRVIAKFGVETDTLDSFGEIKNVENVKITKEDVEKVLPKFIGEISQIPPKFSAIKISGKRACDLMREGKEVEIQPRKINIFGLKFLNDLGNNQFLIEIHCSAGTYVRTLVADIAKELGTVGIATAIIRVKSGLFNLYNALTLKEFEKTKKLLSLFDIFGGMKIVEVDKKTSKKLINGVKITDDEIDIEKEFQGDFVVKFENEIIGLYRKNKNKVEQIVYLYKKF